MPSRQARKKAAQQAAGFCRECETTPVPGRVLCEVHLERQRERKRAREAKRKAAGQCVGCAKRPPTEGSTRCEECRHKQDEMYQAWLRK